MFYTDRLFAYSAFSVIVQSDIFVHSEAKTSRKRSFQWPSNEYKFTYVPRWVCSEKRFFTSAVVFIFSCENAPLQLSEIWKKHRKLTKVVEQTRNVSTWSDRSKKLASTSCVLGIRKSNEHCAKVVSGCWRKNTRKTRVTDTQLSMHDNLVRATSTMRIR